MTDMRTDRHKKHLIGAITIALPKNEHIKLECCSAHLLSNFASPLLSVNMLIISIPSHDINILPYRYPQHTNYGLQLHVGGNKDRDRFIIKYVWNIQKRYVAIKLYRTEKHFTRHKEY